MRVVFYKGVENAPEIYGLSVDYLIPFFLAFTLHLIIMAMLFFSMGSMGFILEAIFLYGFYFAYKKLRKLTLKKSKKLLLKPRQGIQNNMYSIDILHGNTFDKHI